jgi:hypothetical protein
VRPGRHDEVGGAPGAVSAVPVKLGCSATRNPRPRLARGAAAAAFAVPATITWAGGEGVAPAGRRRQGVRTGSRR